MQPRPHTVICDPHELVREGLAAVLRGRGIDVVGNCGRCDDLVGVIDEVHPDVVLADATMVQGLEALPRAAGRSPAYLLVSPATAATVLRHLFDVGAGGVIPPSATVAELVGAIELVAAGESYLHPSLGAALASSDDEPSGLTRREQDVARLIALGHTNPQVAQQLRVSVRTVETHRAHLMRRLHLAHRHELVQWALDQGLIGPAATAAAPAATHEA
jgi:DNA-binding NarL/FixJ family response regulator